MAPTRRQALSAGTAGIAGLIAGCTSRLGNGESDESGPIRFGMTTSLSGANASLGTNYLRGIKIWIDRVNENGGILDREVKLVHYDDSSKPDTSLSQYDRLVTQDNVDLLIGPFGSPINYSAANASSKHGIPMVTGAASDPGLFERGLDMFYSTQAPTTMYARALPKFLTEDVDWSNYDVSAPESVAVMYTESAFTTDMGKAAVGNFEEYGIEVVSEQSHPVNLKDYSNQISRIKDADPDMLAIYGFPSSEATFADQAQSANLNLDFHYQNYSSNQVIKKTLGDKANYMMHGSWWDPRYEYPGVDYLVDEWESRHPDVLVGMASAYGPSAVQAFQAAIEKAGSVEPDAVNEGLNNIDTEGVMGRIQFHKNGYNPHHRKNEAVRQWQNGDPTLLSPAEFADSELWAPAPPWSERGSAPN